MKLSSVSQLRNSIDSCISSAAYLAPAASAASIMRSTRSTMGRKSRTTSRRPRRLRSSDAASASRPASSSRRSIWKCITDSRRGAPRAGVTASIVPSSARSTPMTGWSTTRTWQLKAWISEVTVSTRNGESSTLTSTTEPEADQPSRSTSGL